jgi:hypothetical protein
MGDKLAEHQDRLQILLGSERQRNEKALLGEMPFLLLLIECDRPLPFVAHETQVALNGLWARSVFDGKVFGALMALAQPSEQFLKAILAVMAH